MTKSVEQNQSENLYKNQNRFVEVRIGDDVTKSAWRYESRSLDMALEQSHAWKKFGLTVEILDPFQIASGSDYQYFEPDEPREVFITESGTFFYVGDLEASSIIGIEVINMLNNQVVEEAKMYAVEGEGYSCDYFTASSDGNYINGNIIHEDVKLRIYLDMIPFRPRELMIATGELISAGSELVAGFYSLERKLK